MLKKITVPLSFLEDIFRLLDGFDDLEGLDFHKCGYNPVYDYANAFWEFRHKARQLWHRLVDMHMHAIGDITEDERRSFRAWLAAGNRIYDNPYSLYDESGRPMDFISGCRIGADMWENPSGYVSTDQDAIGGDGIPF
jgi:hypothetical protein